MADTTGGYCLKDFGDLFGGFDFVPSEVSDRGTYTTNDLLVFKNSLFFCILICGLN